MIFAKSYKQQGVVIPKKGGENRTDMKRNQYEPNRTEPNPAPTCEMELPFFALATTMGPWAHGPPLGSLGTQVQRAQGP